MMMIRFDDAETERKALGRLLAGRFALKSWASGETMVPNGALAYLAKEAIRFHIVGPATEEREAAFRRSLSSARHVRADRSEDDIRPGIDVI